MNSWMLRLIGATFYGPAMGALLEMLVYLCVAFPCFSFQDFGYSTVLLMMRHLCGHQSIRV